jgi:hypothetical protein
LSVVGWERKGVWVESRVTCSKGPKRVAGGQGEPSHHITSRFWKASATRWRVFASSTTSILLFYMCENDYRCLRILYKCDVGTIFHYHRWICQRRNDSQFSHGVSDDQRETISSPCLPFSLSCEFLHVFVIHLLFPVPFLPRAEMARTGSSCARQPLHIPFSHLARKSLATGVRRVRVSQGE